MNEAQKNKVLEMERVEKLLFEQFLKTPNEELERKLEVVQIDIHKIIGETTMTYVQRIEMGYKPEDCEYKEMPDGTWHQVIIRGGDIVKGEKLVDWSDPI